MSVEITDADRAIAEKARGTPGGYMAGYAYAAALARTGWKPEPEVDPDWAEVEAIEEKYYWEPRSRIGFEALKRGRELAAPQGWIRHDGSAKCPVEPEEILVAIGRHPRTITHLNLAQAISVDWPKTTHYISVPKPEGAA